MCVYFMQHPEVVEFFDKIVVAAGGQGPHVRCINKRHHVVPTACSVFWVLLFSLHGNNFFVLDGLSDIMFDT